MEKSGICAVCKKVSSSRCTNCRKVWYCGRDHQKGDWKRHKSSCFPIEIASSQIFGRYLVATKNIPQGSIIFKEKPLFSAPNGKNGCFLLCISCYGILDPTNSAPCSKCSWPLHQDTSCTQNPTHSLKECEILAKIETFNSSREENIYDKLLILRGCLLKLKDKENWGKLKELEGHRNTRMETEEGRSMSKQMVSFVREKCGLGKYLTEEEVDHVLGTVLVNAYVTEDNLTSTSEFQCGSFVFSAASMPAHDCIPNCKWTIKKGGEFSLWSLKDIKEGESLTHCYAWGGTGTLERQKHLLRSKYFCCGCARCQDPTECGTFLSGVKCRTNKCEGYVLNKNPLELGSGWACHICNAKITEGQIEDLMESLRDLHSKTVVDSPSPSLEKWRETIENLERHNEFLKSNVHPNHFLVHEVEQDILLRISFVIAQSDAQQISLSTMERRQLADKLVQLSEKCLSVLKLIAPGLTTHTGRQYYYLQQGLGVRIMEGIQGLTSNNESSDNLKQKIAEWQEIRSNGVKILEMESPAREEFVLGQAMKEK